MALSTLHHFLSALACDVEGAPGDAADFIFVIGQGIDGGHDAVYFFGLSGSEVESSGQLAHNHQVETFVADVFAKRAGILELFVEDGRAQVCEET